MLNFVAIDFETANSDRASACALGAVLVHDGIIVDEYYSLIRPHPTCCNFDPFNTEIHGITETDVKDAPELPEAWANIAGSINGSTLVAHYSAFDCRVINDAFGLYGLSLPECAVACSCVISKRMWPELLSFGLSSIAEKIDFQFVHHNALEDARAAAQIILTTFRETGSADWIELEKNLGFHLGVFHGDEYRSCGLKPKFKTPIQLNPVDYSDPELNPDDFPLWKKNFVFTGTLRSMQRNDAMRKVTQAGGGVLNSVNKKTDYLVMGVQDYYKFTDGEKSNKTKKAEELHTKGYPIEIISEMDFLHMLGDSSAIEKNKVAEKQQEERDPMQDIIDETYQNGLQIIRKLSKDLLNPERLSLYQRKTYAAVQIDNDKEKRICCFYTQGNTVSVAFYDMEGKLGRRSVMSNVKELSNHGNEILRILRFHLDLAPAQSEKLIQMKPMKGLLGVELSVDLEKVKQKIIEEVKKQGQ
ncbi:MAG: exonuclease domain-containing protein [Pyramidobacter porci]|uniref:exonuclease domain-containing protein n=1 Tax=Pyramidobacter porci TaxID=2605789 RepID=UPI002A762F92|nr:exonuclease domain-containing protein [Pyramidobacter porci]MDY2648909.1 exonuclease domain-containing protein [Pyramidobacter porci]